jgi:hypothetical protein
VLLVTTLAQAELTDSQRAGHAREKAKRVFPPEIAAAISTRLDDGVHLPAFVDRGRWLALITEVMGLPEAATTTTEDA